MKEMFKEVKIDYKNLYNIILSVLAYAGIIAYYGIYDKLNFNIFFLLLYIPLFLFFTKWHIRVDDKNKKISVVLGLLITIALVVGKSVYFNIDQPHEMIFTLKRAIYAVVKCVFLFPLFYRLLTNVYYFSSKIQLKKDHERKSINQFFLFSWITIFVCHIPYFLCYFPGKITVDTLLQFKYIQEGIFSDFHPFIQTWFVGGIYNFGKLIFHSETIAIAFYVIIQMLIVSALFAYVCRFLYKKKFNIKICLGVLFCYAILPQFTHYSVTVWKDVLFGCAFILVFISLLELKEKIKAGNLLLLVLGLLILLFFRNNGIYILLFITPFVIYSFRKKYKIFLPLMSGLIVFYFVVKGPIFSMIGVSKTISTEALSIPLQQIARVFAVEKSVDNESLAYLNTVTDTTKLKDRYKTYISDPVKGSFNSRALMSTKDQFFKTWLRLFLKHPQVYVESYLAQTTGYWFTDVDYWVTSYKKNEPLLPDFAVYLADLTASKRLPFANVCWSIGLGFIVTLISFSISLYKKNQFLIAYIPFLGLWLTMMVASPVFAEYRYVYGLFTCLPLILFIPFLGDKIKIKKDKM